MQRVCIYSRGGALGVGQWERPVAQQHLQEGPFSQKEDAVRSSAGKEGGGPTQGERCFSLGAETAICPSFCI